MTTGFGYDERCLGHVNGSMLVEARAAEWVDAPHVERPARLERTLAVLRGSGALDGLTALPARAATHDELALVHTSRLIDEVKSGSAAGRLRPIGSGAWVGPGSWEAATRAAGVLLEATAAVVGGQVDNAFAAVRPPGHHASADLAMGFCLFNNVAVAVRWAQRELGVGRVAIVDWDVHHGNGTQIVFEDDPSVLFVSIHQDGLYPADMGTLAERGGPAAMGTTVNVPLPAGCGDAAYARAFAEVVAPALAAFEPEILFVSAGQDPAAADPLGRMRVTTEGFRALTRQAREAANRLCDGRLVVALEGGYSLEHMPFCNLAIVEELAGLTPAFTRDPLDLDVDDAIGAHELAAIERAAAAQS